MSHSLYPVHSLHLPDASREEIQRALSLLPHQEPLTAVLRKDEERMAAQRQQTMNEAGSQASP